MKRGAPLIAGLLVSACFGSPNYEGRLCDSDKLCPAGFECGSDGLCHRDGAAVPQGDSGGAPDAPSDQHRAVDASADGGSTGQEAGPAADAEAVTLDSAIDASIGAGSDTGPGAADAAAAQPDATPLDAGSCAPFCPVGAACTSNMDCTSSVCATTCQAPTCFDGIQNGTETGTDCGGTCGQCGGAACMGGDAVCASHFCLMGTCRGLICSGSELVGMSFVTPNGAAWMNDGTGLKITGQQPNMNPTNHPIIYLPAATSGSRFQIIAKAVPHMAQIEYGLVFAAGANGAWVYGGRYGTADQSWLGYLPFGANAAMMGLATGGVYSSVANSTYVMRVQLYDQEARGKIWNAADPEPGAWGATLALPTLPTDTGAGFYDYLLPDVTFTSLKACRIQ